MTLSVILDIATFFMVAYMFLLKTEAGNCSICTSRNVEVYIEFTSYQVGSISSITFYILLRNSSVGSNQSYVNSS